MEREGF